MKGRVNLRSYLRSAKEKNWMAKRRGEEEKNKSKQKLPQQPWQWMMYHCGGAGSYTIWTKEIGLGTQWETQGRKE